MTAARLRTSARRSASASIAVKAATALLLTAGVSVGMAPVLSPAYATPSPKITICHATSSTSNPYVKMTVDRSSINEEDDHGDNGHGDHTGRIFDPNGGRHQRAWGDIIPSFTGSEHSSFAGLNWSERGQSILSDNCRVTVPVAPPVVEPPVVEPPVVTPPVVTPPVAEPPVVTPPVVEPPVVTPPVVTPPVVEPPVVTPPVVEPPVVTPPVVEPPVVEPPVVTPPVVEPPVVTPPVVEPPVVTPPVVTPPVLLPLAPTSPLDGAGDPVAEVQPEPVDAGTPSIPGTVAVDSPADEADLVEPTTATDSASQLPQTGSDASSLALLGFGLVSFGLFTVVGTRRRQVLDAR